MNDINANTLKVLDDNPELSNAIGLDLHSESNVNEVHISFNDNKNCNIFHDTNDNEDENDENDVHCNENIMNDLARLKNPNKMQPNDNIKNNNNNEYSITIGNDINEKSVN